MVGDFTKELPTAYQVYSAHILQDWFLHCMPQYTSLNSPDCIIGHKDAYELLHLPGATPTACPGSSWRATGDSLRDRVLQNNFSGYPNPQPPSIVPPVPPTTDYKKVCTDVKSVSYGSGQPYKKLNAIKDILSQAHI